MLLWKVLNASEMYTLIKSANCMIFSHFITIKKVWLWSLLRKQSIKRNGSFKTANIKLLNLRKPLPAQTEARGRDVMAWAGGSKTKEAAKSNSSYEN